MRLEYLLRRTRGAALVFAFPLCWAPAGAQFAEAAATGDITAKPNRHICDRHTGLRWVLERDPLNAGGPGRMILDSDVAGSCQRTALTATPKPGQPDSMQHHAARIVAAPPVIRTGDQLEIVESTPRLETRLEAIALSSAAAGSEVTARLSFQNTIVRAVALGPGKASFARVLGVRR